MTSFLWTTSDRLTRSRRTRVVDKRNAAAGIFPPGSLSISWRLTKFQQLFLPTRSPCWKPCRSHCEWMTLVLYRRRASQEEWSGIEGWSARSIKPSEGSRSRVRRARMLWKFNRFLLEKPCQTGTLAKTLLLMLIDVGLPAICVILPPPPSVLQEDSSDACVNIRGSVRRASGFVLMGEPECMVRRFVASEK